MSQKALENTILALIGFVVVFALFQVRSLGDAILSLVLVVVAIILPFLLDSLIRYHLTPWVDSLNVDHDEDFPTYIRVLIWAFMGISLAYAWSYLLPLSFGLPLFYGRLAVAIGWRSLALADGVWQYGWSIVFLVQYLLAFFTGSIFSGNTDLEDSFLYP